LGWRVVSPLLLCPAAGGVFELSGVFGGSLSFSRSAAFLVLQRFQPRQQLRDQHVLLLGAQQTEIRRRDHPSLDSDSSPRRHSFPPSESIRRTCWQQCLNASINHPQAWDVSNYEH
jgi:hypothetical protein